MDDSGLWIEFKNHFFASRHRHIAVCGKAAQPTMNGRRRRRVVEVNIMVNRRNLDRELCQRARVRRLPQPR